MCRRFTLLFALPCLLIGMSGALSAESKSPGLDTEVVTAFSENNPYGRLVSHQGFFWLTRYQPSVKAPTQIEVYSAKGKLKASVKLPFAVKSLTPFDKDTLIASGWTNIIDNQLKNDRRPFWETRSFYSLLSFREDTEIEIKTYEYPRAYPEYWDGDITLPYTLATNGEDVYVSEPGTRSVMRLEHDALVRLYRDIPEGVELPDDYPYPIVEGRMPVDLPFPEKMVVVGDYLYVVAKNSPQDGDELLVRINLANRNKTDLVFDHFRNGLKDMVAFEELELVAVSERKEDLLHLIDVKNNTVEATLKLHSKYPEYLARLGSCVVVGSTFERRLNFYDVSKAELPHVSQWDLSEVDPRFYRVDSIAIDSSSQTVFLRSNEFCANCEQTRAAVIRATEKNGVTFERCLGE